MGNISSIYQSLLGLLFSIIKEQGFKKKDNTFFINEHNNWGIINFQKSSKSNDKELFFTINLGVINQSIYSFLSGLTEIQKTSVLDAHWRIRIGHLLPQNKDYWWSLNQNTPIEGIVKEVAEVLITVAIPRIKELTDDQILRDFWLSSKPAFLTESQKNLYLAILIKKNGPEELLLPTIKKILELQDNPSTLTFQYYIDKLLKTK